MPKVYFLAAQMLEMLTWFWTSEELGFRKVAWMQRKPWYRENSPMTSIDSMCRSTRWNDT